VGSFKHMEISHVIVKLPVTVECMLIDGDSFNAEYLCTGRYDVEGVFERDGKRYLRMRHAEHKILDIVNEDYLLHGIMLPSRDSAREVHYCPVGTPDQTPRCSSDAQRAPLKHRLRPRFLVPWRQLCNVFTWAPRPSRAV
jgi:hypothetical protein